ncbi:unnamed protein product [Amaranthus hypochondriacus]
MATASLAKLPLTPSSSSSSQSSSSSSTSIKSNHPQKISYFPLHRSSVKNPTLLQQSNTQKQEQQGKVIIRRDLLLGISVLPFVLEVSPSESKEVEVGSFLPPSSSDPSFVFFKASSKDTPALRAVMVLQAM